MPASRVGCHWRLVRRCQRPNRVERQQPEARSLKPAPPDARGRPTSQSERQAGSLPPRGFETAARRNIPMDREPMLIAACRCRKLAGCRRRKLAQLVAAPKVILPRITFGITCGRRSPLAARIAGGKPAENAHRGEKREADARSVSHVRKFVITFGDRWPGRLLPQRARRQKADGGWKMEDRGWKLRGMKPALLLAVFHLPSSILPLAPSARRSSTLRLGPRGGFTCSVESSSTLRLSPEESSRLDRARRGPKSLLRLLNPALQAYHECEMCQRAYRARH